MKTSKNAFLKFIIGYIQSDTDPRGAYNNPENISIPITAIKPPCLNHLCNCDKRIPNTKFTTIIPTYPKSTHASAIYELPNPPPPKKREDLPNK